MADSSTAAASSPPRRFSAPNSASLLWASQQSEPHGSIWASYASPLQPSTSIWGPQIKDEASQLSHAAPPKHYPPHLPAAGFSMNAHPQQLGSPQMNIGKFGPAGSAPQPRQRRMSSVTSLGGTLNNVSSSLWFEDPYLVSPPPSPEAVSSGEVHSAGTSVLSGSAPGLSPLSSPTFASVSLMPASQEEFVISPSSGPLYFVQFKGDRVDVFTAPGTAVYKLGDAVMVDADRGRDLGTIVGANVSRRDAAALKQRQSQDRQNALHNNISSGVGGTGSSVLKSSTSASSATAINTSPNSLAAGSPTSATSGEAANGPTIYNPKQILGVASPSEISDMITKINDEAAAIALCNKKAAERRLEMQIVDAEYQWDRRKLTFFYTADARVDFRDLVRELFRIYKTRIWMCATTARS